MKQCTIFYSWQSENKDSREYVEKSINDAIEYMNERSNQQITARIDRDTKGKLGSPNIPKTIEEKINKCDIFIADLSVIHEVNGKKQINQNVMYETGYAIAKLGDNYCILLHNSDSCEPKDLPFDIAQRRLLIYSKNSANLKTKLLEVLPMYAENTILHKKIQETSEEELSAWEKEILQLFKSIKGEKRLIISKAGAIGFAAGQRDKNIQQKISRHNDPQEIRAAFTDLVDKKYLECYYAPNGTAPNYSLLQKGYNYIYKN
ncbi:nucleotide-binding protein [Candidatus Saccharibacteria bacterium]|nr:nucleotide-binding protein [Candidatus Saccharibacteria bacterium]